MSDRYDLPLNYVFTFTLGSILAGVVLNLWRYIIDLYADVLAVFTVLIGFPSLIAIGCIFLAIVIKKNEERIAPVFQVLADSIIVGALAGIAGFYLQEGITKLFYLYWFTRVAPTVAAVFFVFVVLAMLHCGRPLWSTPKASHGQIESKET